MRFCPTRVAQARSARLLYGHRLLAGALGVLVGVVSLAVDPGVHRGHQWRETRVSRGFLQLSLRRFRSALAVAACSFPLLLEYGATAVAQYLHRSKSRYKLSPHTATRENAALVSLVVLIQRICLNIGPPPGLLHRDAREIDKIVVSGCEGPSIAKLRNVLVV